MDLYPIAVAVWMATWAGFAFFFIRNARRIQRQRREHPETEAERKSIPGAKWGLVLQGVGFFIGNFRRPHAALPPEAFMVASMILSPLSLALGSMAVRELGIQWRIQAVVTGTHKLITTGPYRWVRHPIYTSLFGMMVAGSFINSTWPMTIVAAVLYLIGTEIRIAAEERLLAEQFGREFSEFRARVPAYIPFVR